MVRGTRLRSRSSPRPLEAAWGGAWVGGGGESKTRLFSRPPPRQPRPFRTARGVPANPRRSGHKAHPPRRLRPLDKPRPRAPTSPGIISAEFQAPPPEPTPRPRPCPPLGAPPPGRRQPRTWCRAAEVHRAPQRPLRPVRRWGGLAVGVAAGVSAGPEGSGDSEG